MIIDGTVNFAYIEIDLYCGFKSNIPIDKKYKKFQNRDVYPYMNNHSVLYMAFGMPHQSKWCFIGISVIENISTQIWYKHQALFIQ
jgi:hypothetical protein